MVKCDEMLLLKKFLLHGHAPKSGKKPSPLEETLCKENEEKGLHQSNWSMLVFLLC